MSGKRRPVRLELAYRLINPGPMALVCSLLDGRAGLTPIAWHMPFSDDPPLIALEIWKGHFVHKAILQTGDFTVNIPADGMADTVRKLGGVSGHKVDKFKEFGLRKARSKKIKSPSLASAIGVLECRLHPEKALLKKYSVILGDVVYAEADRDAFSERWLPEKAGPRTLHHLGGKVFSVPDTRALD